MSDKLTDWSYSIRELDGTTVFVLPLSSSLRSQFQKINENRENFATSNQLPPKLYSSFEDTNNYFQKIITPDLSVLDSIVSSENRAKERIVKQYLNEFRNLILQDEFIDGEISKSEQYMQELYRSGQINYASESLMLLYSQSLSDEHILEGILTVISCVPYDAIAPQGQIMAVGLLSNKILSVRDKAIQCFERWNSKKGLSYLRSLDCHPSWLQKYVGKVISYIERDGEE